MFTIILKNAFDTMIRGMNYDMGGTVLSKTAKENDLGVSMNANMKVSEQCRIAASRGNHIL